jgi:hypothetical protein
MKIELSINKKRQILCNFFFKFSFSCRIYTTMLGKYDDKFLNEKN